MQNELTQAPFREFANWPTFLSQSRLTSFFSIPFPVLHSFLSSIRLDHIISMYLFPAPHVHASTFLALFRNYCSVTSTGAHWNITGHCFSSWHTVLQLLSPWGSVHKCPSSEGSYFGGLLLMHMGPQRVAVNYPQFLSLLLGLAKVSPDQSSLQSSVNYFMTLDGFWFFSSFVLSEPPPSKTRWNN